MTDLETRVREGLSSDLAGPSAHDVIADVRRDARRRRARRMTGVLAATVILLAAVGGGVARHRAQQTADRPGVPHHLSGAMAVSVTGSGTVYKVVGNEGCSVPCSTVWRLDRTTGWVQVSTIEDTERSAHFFGPVLAIEMSPSGHDGWMWGPSHMWSTHDGGATWTRVSSAPFAHGNPWEELADVVSGPTYTWVSLATDGHPRRLWRTPTGSDEWTPIDLPQHSQGTIAAVLPDSRVAIPRLVGTLGDDMRRVRRHGRVVRLIEQFDVGDGTGPWQRVQVPCVTVTLPTPSTTGSSCGPGGRLEGGGGGLIGPKTTDGSPRYRDLMIQLGVTGSDSRHPLGHQTELHVTRHVAHLVTPGGAIQVKLHLDNLSTTFGSASQGQHSVFIDGNHRVHASDDGGLHWRELP